jgi:hypothetical protein
MRGRGQGAFDARRVYRPHLRRHRWVYGVTSSYAALGLGPRAEAPDGDIVAVVEDVAHALRLRADAMVARRSWAADRWVIAVASRGVLAAIVKVGGTDDVGLRTELEMLEAMRARQVGFATPSVLWAGDRDARPVLVTSPMGPRSAHVLDVAAAGQVATLLTAPPDGDMSLVHGDLTPWNLWRDGAALMLIDWESATVRRRPLWDLAWYVVSAGALGGAWGHRDAVDLLIAPGGPGADHVRAVGLDSRAAPRLLGEVLDEAHASQVSDVLKRYMAAMRDQLPDR